MRVRRTRTSAAAGQWWVFFVLATAVTTVAWLTGAEGGFSVAAIRHVVRLTAQTSLVLFCTAFASSALVQQWPNGITRFVRRNRRQIGVSFAFSHAVHAIALVAFAQVSPAQFREATDPAMFIVGGLAYAFIIAMTATSFDRTARWLGPRAWRVLHTLGAYDIWITFLVAEGKRALHSTYYWPYVALLIVVMGLRLGTIAARIVRRASVRDSARPLSG